VAGERYSEHKEQLVLYLHAMEYQPNTYRGFDDRGWICDTCGGIIKLSEDGWVEWCKPVKNGKVGRRGQDFRLVHHTKSRDQESKCQFDDHDRQFMVLDLPLDSFLGSNGLMRLLALVADRKVKSKEVLEMIKRLHIPGYEHTRLHFDEAISEGVFEPNTARGYYHMSNIRAVDEWLKSAG
jgi:hypothetical protein